MDEKLLENQELSVESNEPEIDSDNSTESNLSNSEISRNAEEQSVDSSAMILGKFKTQDDLIKAYQNLEKVKGSQASEIGTLRQNEHMWREAGRLFATYKTIVGNPQELQEKREQYPEHFENSAFRELYQEAYKLTSGNIDTDRIVRLMDEYAANKIDEYIKKQAANAETEKVLSGLKFEKNNNSDLKPAPKRLDEMTKQEIDEMIRTMI